MRSFCGGTLSAGETGVAAASITLNSLRFLVRAGTLQVDSAGTLSALTINAGLVAADGTATVDGIVTLGVGGTLTASVLDLGAGARITGQGMIDTGSSGTITDDGRIGTRGGTLTVGGTIGGDGVLGVRAGTLVLQHAESAGVGVVFGNAGTLVTPTIADLGGTISGWQPNDAIDFIGAAIATFSYAGGALSLFDSGHYLLGTEQFAGMLKSSDFTLTSELHGGTLLAFRT